MLHQDEVQHRVRAFAPHYSLDGYLDFLNNDPRDLNFDLFLDLDLLGDHHFLFYLLGDHHFLFCLHDYRLDDDLWLRGRTGRNHHGQHNQHEYDTECFPRHFPLLIWVLWIPTYC